jgi:AbrB family looped-hinge helix DNA binding protein
MQDGLAMRNIYEYIMAADVTIGNRNWVFPITMTTEITLDRAGRVLIPKSLRERLHLQPGDVLQLESQGDDITIRPQRSNPSLVKERGIWILSTGEPTAASIPDLIEEQRELRNRHVLGLDSE